MKVKKILIVVCVIILLSAASLCGAIFYYYYHPSAVKPLIERAVSSSSGTSLTIETLSYSLQPLRVRANGITVQAPGNEYSTRLEITRTEADMAFSGPFGHKTLTFRSLKIDGFAFQVSEKATLPGKKKRERRTSFLSRMLKGATGLFLFRDIALDGAALVNGHFAGRFGDKTLRVHGMHAEMDAEHRIAISGNLQIAWPSQNLLFTAPQLQLITNAAVSFLDPEIMATLTATNATYDGPLMIAKGLAVKAEIIYSQKQKAFLFKSEDIYAEELGPKQAISTEWPSTRLWVKTKGVFNIQERKLEASSLDLSLSDTMQLRGKLEMGFRDATAFKLQILDNHFLAQDILTLLPDTLIKRWPPLTLSGPVQINGSINGLREKGEWGLNFDLQTSLKSNHITYGMAEIKLDSQVSGSIQASGKFPDIDMSVKLQGDKTMISGLGIQPEPFKVGLHLYGRHPIYLFKDLSVQMPRAKLALGKKDLFLDHLHMLAEKGEMDIRERTLFLPELRLDSSLLKNLLLALKLGKGELSVDIRGKEVRLMESAFDLNLLPSDWQIHGKDSLQLNVILNKKGDGIFASELGLQDLGFQNKEGSSMGEKISLHLKTDGRFGLKDSHVDAQTSLTVAGGEVLFDRFYLDLNRNAFLSSIKTEYDLARKYLKLPHLRLQLKDIINLAMSGTVDFKAREPRVHLAVSFPKTSLKPIFRHFILEPFKAEKPFLVALDVGGTISGDLKLTGSRSDWNLKGRWGWHGGRLSPRDGAFSLEGIDLDLPVWHHRVPALARQSTRSALDSPMVGHLSIQSLSLPFLPEQPLEIPLDAVPNRLSVPSSTILRVPGGKIELGPVLLGDVYSSQPSIETSLTLDAMELGPLLRGIWPRPVGETIEGKLRTIRLEKNVVQTEGDLRAKVFGGEILISGLGASRLFTSAPLFKLNAWCEDLRLDLLTGETAFGKIEGILEGYINDLEVAFGQPQKFDLLLQTARKEGIPQKMSQRAVDSIAQIGGGQSPFMGVAGMMTSFFKEFPYEKIGIRAILENDVFRVHGTIRENGTEYYVKGSGLPRVNVVNMNPDNRISFKDMVKRIRRITTSKSSPVVK